jgi:hypothetical protein
MASGGGFFSKFTIFATMGNKFLSNPPENPQKSAKNP